MTERFVTKVVKEGDDLVFLFPEDFIKKLRLKDHDILQWEVADDGRISIQILGSVLEATDTIDGSKDSR